MVFLGGFCPSSPCNHISSLNPKQFSDANTTVTILSERSQKLNISLISSVNIHTAYHSHISNYSSEISQISSEVLVKSKRWSHCSPRLILAFSLRSYLKSYLFTAPRSLWSIGKVLLYVPISCRKQKVAEPLQMLLYGCRISYHLT